MTNCSLYQTLLHMTNLQCMLFCLDLRCFDAKFILSRITHICVEQILTQKSCPWSKNDKYDVCFWESNQMEVGEENAREMVFIYGCN